MSLLVYGRPMPHAVTIRRVGRCDSEGLFGPAGPLTTEIANSVSELMQRFCHRDVYNRDDSHCSEKLDTGARRFGE